MYVYISRLFLTYIFLMTSCVKYTKVCIHTYSHMLTHTDKHTSTYIHPHLCTNLYARTHVHIKQHTHKHTPARKHIDRHIFSRTHIYSFIYILTQTHTQKKSRCHNGILSSFAHSLWSLFWDSAQSSIWSFTIILLLKTTATREPLAVFWELSKRRRSQRNVINLTFNAYYHM